MDVIAEGLAFPEGPVVMADGSVIVVEIMAGRVTRCWDGKSETVCKTGGGPNGAAFGPDGRIWLCNNGGRDERGCIQAVADRMLTRDDQRLAASFFKDPQRAQDVRMSKTDRDNLFWDRYERFGQAAAQNCN